MTVLISLFLVVVTKQEKSEEPHRTQLLVRCSLAFSSEMWSSQEERGRNILDTQHRQNIENVTILDNCTYGFVLGLALRGLLVRALLPWGAFRRASFKVSYTVGRQRNPLGRGFYGYFQQKRTLPRC